jgi:molecular chaperone DnaK (HSP70)
MANEKEIKFTNTGAKKFIIHILPENQPFKGLSLLPSNTFELTPEQTQTVTAKLDSAQIPPGFKIKQLRLKCHINRDKNKAVGLVATIKSGPQPKSITKNIVFGDVTGGTTAECSAIILNDGGIPLGIRDIQVEGKDNSQFQLSEKKSPSKIQPGARLTIPVNWSIPKTDGVKTVDAKLKISFQNVKRDLVIPIQGTVYKVALELLPPGIQIEGAIPKKTYRRTVKLQNLGLRDIEIKKIETTPASPWISLIHTPTPFTLTGHSTKRLPDQLNKARSGSESILLQCSPKSLSDGIHHGTITIHTNPPFNDTNIKVSINVVTPKPCVECVGIDFGTTNSVVAIWDNQHNTNQLVLEKNPSTQKSNPLIPSVLVFGRSATDYKIGYEAENDARTKPELTARSVKHIMGSQSERTFHGKKFLPKDLCSLILQRLVEMAERQLFTKSNKYSVISNAIVTVPSSFDDIQIGEILAACDDAGLELSADDLDDHNLPNGSKAQKAGIILDEPSAAAFYFLSNKYGIATWRKKLFDKLSIQKKVNFLIYDHGGGTLDISIIEITRKGKRKLCLKVIASKGSNKVGGDQIDLLIMEKLLLKARRIYPGFDHAMILAPFKAIAERKNREKWDHSYWAQLLGARDRWKKHGEDLKIKLSNEEQANITISPRDIFPAKANIRQPELKEYQEELKVSELNEIITPILNKSLDLVNKTLRMANLSHDNIDYVIHSGRTSLIRKIQETISESFNMLQQEDIILEEENLKICVALGAALYGFIRELPNADFYFVNGGRILPHSYGISQADGFRAKFKEIIKTGAKYPTKKKFSIPTNGQNKLTIRVLQNSGSKTDIAQNPEIKSIGEISLPVSTDNSKVCRVEFKIDINRRLEVLANGKKIDITPVQLENEDLWNG